MTSDALNDDPGTFTNSSDLVMSNTLDDMLLSLYISIFFSLLLLLFYDIQRRLTISTYFPKLMPKYISRFNLTAPSKPMPFRFLNWPLAILRIAKDEDAMIGFMGVDAFMFTRYCKLCLKFLFTLLLIGMCILLPLFYEGHNEQSGLTAFSMSNLVLNSDRLWVVFGVVYFISYYFVNLLTKEYKAFVRIRETHVSSRSTNSGLINSTSIKTHSVMVEEIPENLRSDAALGDFFERLFTGDVVHACVMQDLSLLEAVLERRETCVANLERVIARREGWIRMKKYELDDCQPFHVEGGCFGFYGKKVDSIEFYTDELERLNDEVDASQRSHLTAAEKINQVERLSIEEKARLKLEGADRANSSSGVDSLTPETTLFSAVKGISLEITKGVKSTALGVITDILQVEQTFEMVALRKEAGYSSTGFVLFKTYKSAAAARQMLLDFNGSTTIVGTLPPEPRDVNWKNVAMSSSQIRARQLIVKAALIWGILAWGTIVSSINTLTNFETLWCPFLGYKEEECNVLTEGVFGSLISGYLPVIALISAIALLPILFRSLAKYAGAKSSMEEQQLVLDYYFGYQVANVFIVTISGSISGVFFELIDKPQSVFTLLGESIPSVAYYFAQFIIVKAFVSTLVELARPWPAIQLFFLRKLNDHRTLSMRELTTGARGPPVLDYGEKYPEVLLVLLICLVYSCISPIILLFGVIYFSFAYVIMTNQFLYVYIPSFDTGGVFWYQIYRKSIGALVIMQLTLIGYMSIREGFLQSVLMLPLPFLTLYRSSSVIELYEKNSGQLSLNQATEMDATEATLVKQKLTDECSPSNFTGIEYVQPALTVKRAVPCRYRDVVDGEIYGVDDVIEDEENDGGDGAGVGGGGVGFGLEGSSLVMDALQSPLIPVGEKEGDGNGKSKGKVVKFSDSELLSNSSSNNMNKAKYGAIEVPSETAEAKV